MPISKITALPIAPQRTDPVNFSIRGDAWISAFTNTTVQEMNTVVDGMNLAASTVDSGAVAAATAALNAAASANTASLTANATPWVSGTSYAQNQCVVSQIDFRTYRRRTSTGSGTIDPSVDRTNYVIVSSSSLARLPKSAAYSVVSPDNNSLIEVAGTFNLTFSSPVNLGTNWFCYVENSGSGNVTVLPTSGLIDGLASYVMYPNEVRLFQCDGVQITSIVVQSFRLTSQVSSNFVKPPGYSLFNIRAVSGGNGGAGGGGGGGSSGNPASTSGGSGGSGGTGGAAGVPAMMLVASSILPASVPYIIGAGAFGTFGGAGAQGSTPSGSVNGGNGSYFNTSVGGASSFGTPGAFYYFSTGTPSQDVGAGGGGTAGAGGNGSSSTSGVGGVVGNASTGTLAPFVGNASGCLNLPNTKGAVGGASPPAPAATSNFAAPSAGGVGGVGGSSIFAVALPGGAGGVAPTQPDVRGNIGAGVLKAPAGCGGSGGGGGSGCPGRGTASGPVTTFGGGDGGKGGDGGDGMIEIVGVA